MLSTGKIIKFKGVLPMIEVKNLTQTYRSGKGVFDLDFTIKEGEVFGYLGPNGAGKTTTIRNLLGFTNADSGTATINGIDCRKDTAKIQGMIGYLPGEMAFLDNMTGIEFLKFMGSMRKTKDCTRRDHLIEYMELEPHGKIKKMSKGMKQKLGIITAFMHDPAVYILDEPSSGLDPFMQVKLMDLLREEKSRGKTLMMSSHIFEEVQMICDRAGIIRDGRIAAIEDVHSLNAMKQEHYIVNLSSEEDRDRIVASPLETTVIDKNKVDIAVGKNYQEMFNLLAKCNVTGFESKHQSLEDVFMKYYGEDGKSNE